MRELANFVAFLALVLTLLMVWRQSWPARLRLFTLQALLLAFLTAAIAYAAGEPGHYFVAAAVVIVKCGVIPRVLRRIAAGSPLRPVTPGRSSGLAVLAAGGLVVVAFAVMLPVARAVGVPTAGAMPLAFAMVLIGLLACVTGRDAFGHILGFLMLENGIFALALLASYGLPGIVEIGVFLDLLAIVVIMEGVVVQIRREHDSIEIDRLRELRG